jgi:hypothetical protein
LCDDQGLGVFGYRENGKHKTKIRTQNSILRMPEKNRQWLGSS